MCASSAGTAFRSRTGFTPSTRTKNARLDPDPVYDAEFAYTVGLWTTQNHPELVLVGAWAHSHATLAAAVHLIEAGAGFRPGDYSSEVLEEYPVRFGAVSNEQAVGLLTYADWANQRQPFKALQLIVPDAAGRWPDEVGYDSHAQPLLA
jgi:hypothetical protein